MDYKIKIMCANNRHELVIVHFIEQIQDYIDKITKNDEDFVVFINVLSELVRKSNEDVIFSFLGGDYQEKWLKGLPMMIYYAVVGYMHMIDVSLLNLIDTTEKLNNLLNETLDSIDLIIDYEDFDDNYYKINLN
jgi:hypothetical protein|tara:strand:- start:20794 stop:21195 length:402 start_codon:yes stop_codon:yes gene_type:complete